MLKIYYNDKGLNLINEKHESILYPFFQSTFINLYDNELIFEKIIKNNTSIQEKNSLFKMSKNGIYKINLDFPFQSSMICRIFSLYEYPKYYSPTFDYENTENKYYLGVYNTKRSIPEFDALEYGNSILFLMNKNTGEIDWYWSLDNYLKENNISFTTETMPAIQSAIKIGKNKIGLSEETILISLSMINQILFIQPYTGKIELILTAEDFLDKTITSFIDAHIIPEGLEGEGNLLFYNNNFDKLNYSEIIEYDLVNKKIVFEFSNEHLMTRFMNAGSVQKLPNGNYYIYNYQKRKLIEVDKNKNIISIIQISVNYGDEYNKTTQFAISPRSYQIPEEWATNFINKIKTIENFVMTYEE